MKAQDDVHARRARAAPRAGRDRGAAEAALLHRLGLRAAPPPGPVLPSRAARDEGEVDRLLEGGKERRGARAARPEHAGPTTAASRSAAGRSRGTARTVAYKVQQNNSDEATLYVMDVATGKTLRGRRHRGRASTPTRRGRPKGDGFYYTWLPTDPAIPVADRPGFAEVRFHKLGEDPKKDRVVREQDGRSEDLPRRGPLARTAAGWCSPSPHGWTSNDVYFRDLRRPGEEGRGQPLAVGRDAHFTRRGLQGPVLRPHRRGRAALPRLRGRSDEAGARRVEGDRPGAPGRHARQRLDRRRAPRARRYLEGRVEPGRGPRRSTASWCARSPLPGIGTVGRPVRAARRGRGVFLVRVVHLADRDPRDLDEDGRDRRSTRGQGARRPVAVHASSRSSTRRRTARGSRCSSSAART